ncbi:MAG: AIPR family protein [Candidatus Acidiferrum sp.]
MYEQKQLFDFILDRVEDTASENGLKLPQAFGRWFASMYFDKPQNFFISDGSGDGKVDLFFETSDGRNVDHLVLNTKFTEKYNASAPVGFYDEISRFWQAFANKANRNSYLSVVRTELKPKYRKLFEYYDDGNAQLFFVTNHRRNERQFEAVKANGVRIFHLDEILQFTLDYLEDAMPRTPSMLLTGINTVLSADKRDTEIPTSIVFAKLIDFVKYMEGDPYDLLFARNVRLSLGNTTVNKEIRATFKDSPTEFVFSNNGITMLCEQHTHDPGKQEIKIENPRIVNGSQTLHSIRDVSNPSLTARVMVRIIEVPPLDPDDFSARATKKRDVIDKISIRSNRQNPIKPWNLVSTDDFQHDLARFFRKKRLYYERRDKEWVYRRTELKSLGIRRGPDIKWLAQLISSYHWDSKLLGPVPAKARLGELFEGKSYDLIKKSKPELAYQLYLLGLLLENSVWELAGSKRPLAWQALLTLFSLWTKALQQAKIDFGEPDATPFFEASHTTHKWIKLCKACVDYIRSIYRRDTKQYLDRTGQEMTLANYFKSANYLGKILERPVPQKIKKLAKQLARDKA